MYINYIILNNLFEYINYCSLIGWNSYQSDVLMIMCFYVTSLWVTVEEYGILMNSNRKINRC